MARKKETTTTALTQWDEELAKQAAEAATQEANTGGNPFFSARGGKLTLDGNQLPNNEAVVIILDAVLENVYYPDDFDPDSPAAPSCYAFGRSDDTMAPHEAAPEKQAESCGDCKFNEWGSADRGRGKACRNRRRLACIPAGSVDGDGNFEPVTDEQDVKQWPMAFLNLPPTSLVAWGGYVKQLAASIKRPPHAVFTLVKLIPDPKVQFKYQFESLGPVPAALLGSVMERHGEARERIEFPYPAREEREEAPPARGRGRTPAATKRGAGRSSKY